MTGRLLLALLGLCVPLAAGRQGLVVKDFDLNKVGSRAPARGASSRMEPPGRA